MTKTGQDALRRLIKRLESPSLGGVYRHIHEGIPKLPEGLEPVSRVYVGTWLIGPLKLLLDGPDRDPALARTMLDR